MRRVCPSARSPMPQAGISCVVANWVCTGWEAGVKGYSTGCSQMGSSWGHTKGWLRLGGCSPGVSQVGI